MTHPLLITILLTGAATIAWVSRRLFWPVKRRFHPCRSRYLSTVSSQVIEVTDFDIHYLHQGEGDPVILIHGGGMWLYSYRHNLPELAKNFSVYAIDMPGYGYTRCRTDTSPYSIDSMADTIAGFMDKMNIEKASLAGHSWGGGWVIHFAHRYPDRVERLILIDSSGLDVKDVLEWELLKIPILGKILVRCISEEIVRRRLEHSFYHRGLLTDDMVHEVYAPLTFSHNQKALLKLCRNMDWKATEKSLGDIKKPILLIWGDNDRYLDPALAQEFLKRCSHIRLEMIKDCGHSAHEEYPGAVNSLIREFLGKEGNEVC